MTCKTPPSEAAPPVVETPMSTASPTLHISTDESAIKGTNLENHYEETPFLDNKGAVLHPDLAILIADIIPGLETKNTRLPIFKSLVHSRIKCWDHFIDSDVSELQNLSFKEK